MKFLKLFTLTILLGACTKSPFIADVKVLDQSSQEDLANGGDGAVIVTFNSPLPSDLATAPFKVSLSVDPLSELRELKLFVNSTEAFRFVKVPFETTIDPNKYSGCLITLKAQALDRNQRYSNRTLQIKKYADCNTDSGNGPNEPPPSSKTAGTFDTNCLSNNTYDACIFWKNPVAQRGSSYSSPLQFGQAIPEQTFGVKLTGMTSNNRLENNSISVKSSLSAPATPSGNAWRFPYKDDSNNHNVAQVMAYFWLTYQEQQMISRTGKFYAANKRITVDAYNSLVQNNAYWDTQGIVMGIATPNGGSHEMALSAEVYLHEMGHANFQFAVGRFLNDSNAGSNPNLCATSNGCIGAINEGQADFHFAMLFWDNTALGETFVNNINGISQSGINRNPAKTLQMKAYDYFSKSSGEIHGMGSFYSSVLWSIYTDPQMNKKDFEKLFTAHLTMFTESTRFPEARDILIAQDANLFSGKYKSLITAAFLAKGI